MKNHSSVIRFVNTVIYEWNVYLDFLKKSLDDDSLVFVYGDHQLYFADSSDYRVLVHILSKNKSLLKYLSPKYFSKGMVPKQDQNNLTNQNLIFELLRQLSKENLKNINLSKK